MSLFSHSTPADRLKNARRRENLSAAQMAKVREWHQARTALGSAKVFAHKIGCTESQVRAAVGRLKEEH